MMTKMFFDQTDKDNDVNGTVVQDNGPRPAGSLLASMYPVVILRLAVAICRCPPNIHLGILIFLPSINPPSSESEPSMFRLQIMN